MNDIHKIFLNILSVQKNLYRLLFIFINIHISVSIIVTGINKKAADHFSKQYIVKTNKNLASSHKNFQSFHNLIEIFLGKYCHSSLSLLLLFCFSTTYCRRTKIPDEYDFTITKLRVFMIESSLSEERKK